jgi:hypothetical protein
MRASICDIELAPGLKDRAVEKSFKSLDEQIEKWKADNGATGPVTLTAEKN